MAKTFTTAPRPTSAAIEAFERGGLGHDTQTHKPTKVETIGSSCMPRTTEPTKRLSLDVPDSWHHRFKTACTASRKSMVGELLDYLKRRTVELEEGR